MAQIKHGFQGQRMIILPFYIVDKMENDLLMNDLYIHSLGYFPHAKYHYIDRPNGCPEHILIYCSDGQGWFEVDGECHSLEADQWVILSADKPHRYGASGENPWSIYWVHFKGYKSVLFSPLFNKLHSIPAQNNSRIGERIKLFDEIYRILDDSFEQEVLHYANLCFLYFLGTITYLNAYRSSKESLRYGTSIVNLATHYMSENLEKKLKLDEIACYFGYSPSYFYRLFYKSIGYAPMEYFNLLKIQKASYYLLNTNWHINEISFNLGFDDPYYFSRLFKKIIKISPAKYRSQNGII